MPTGSVTPAGAFNGGTITQPFKIRTDAILGHVIEASDNSASHWDFDLERTDVGGGAFGAELDIVSEAAPSVLRVKDHTSGSVVTLDTFTGFYLENDEGRVSGSQILQVVSDLFGTVMSVLVDSTLFNAPVTAQAAITAQAGLKTRAITSGALPTTTFVSGTGKQVLTTRDVCLVVPFTGDATNNAATLLIELSSDNVTYSTLDTLSIAAALNLTGAINTPVTLQVPAAWYVKLTATHGTIGTATYY